MKILDIISQNKSPFYVAVAVNFEHKTFILACNSRKEYIYFCPDEQWHDRYLNINYYFSTPIEAKQCLKKYHPEAIILDYEIFLDKAKSQKDLDFNAHYCNEKTVE
jgi:hypothetical protein